RSALAAAVDCSTGSLTVSTSARAGGRHGFPTRRASDLGILNAGDTVTVTVSFTKAVTVDETGGTPRLALLIGSDTVQATYLEGSEGAETSELQSRQTLVCGLLLENNASNALDRNGGTIR